MIIAWVTLKSSAWLCCRGLCVTCEVPQMTACGFHHLLTSVIYHIIVFFLLTLASFEGCICVRCVSCLCVLLMTDRWRCEGQPAVGVGPHSHSVWKETDEEVGEPAPHRPAVSTGPSDEARLYWMAPIQLLSLILSFIFSVLHSKCECKDAVSSWVQCLRHYYMTNNDMKSEDTKKIPVLMICKHSRWTI